MTRPTTRRYGKHFSQEGIALIVVSVAISVIAALAFEFGADTTVDSMSGANARDSMRAEFLTRSALNLTHLIIRVQTDVVDKYRKYLGDFQLADYTGLFMGAFGGDKEEVAAFGAMIGGFQEDKLKGLGSEGGTFDVDISTEDGKLNMNCANGSAETQKDLLAFLGALMYFDAYNPVFESPDAEGYQRDRALQAAALVDYVDRDQAKSGQPGTPEDYGYETLDDKYHAKNNYIDTASELKLVRGVDDRFWTLFGGSFTVYGDCKINLGAVADPRIIAAIIYLSAKSPDDPVLRDPKALWGLAKRVAGARGMGVFFDDLQAFSDYVKNPDGSISELYAQQGLAPPPELSQGGQPLRGVELDATKLGRVAKTGPRRTYRIEVTATVPRAIHEWTLTKKTTAIWDTQTQTQNARDPSAGRGAWVYWREE